MAMSRRGFWGRTCAAALFAVCAASSLSFASDSRPVPISERIQGADLVVVATPNSVTASWRENTFGDRLIVSRYILQVHETLKGRAGQAIPLDMDGGSLDGFTLRISSSPTLVPGERAVFFLDGGNGAYHAHLKGLGILKLNEQDVVRGSSLTLDEIRRVAASAAQ
jgi:hypothetical protein